VELANAMLNGEMGNSLCDLDVHKDVIHPDAIDAYNLLKERVKRRLPKEDHKWKKSITYGD